MKQKSLLQYFLVLCDIAVAKFC